MCYSSRWTYICDDVYWSSSAAEVVCRQAGFSRSGNQNSLLVLPESEYGIKFMDQYAVCV